MHPKATLTSQTGNVLNHAAFLPWFRGRESGEGSSPRFEKGQRSSVRHRACRKRLSRITGTAQRPCHRKANKREL